MKREEEEEKEKEGKEKREINQSKAVIQHFLSVFFFSVSHNSPMGQTVKLVKVRDSEKKTQIRAIGPNS